MADLIQATTDFLGHKVDRSNGSLLPSLLRRVPSRGHSHAAVSDGKLIFANHPERLFPSGRTTSGRPGGEVDQAHCKQMQAERIPRKKRITTEAECRDCRPISARAQLRSDRRPHSKERYLRCRSSYSRTPGGTPPGFRVMQISHRDKCIQNPLHPPHRGQKMNPKEMREEDAGRRAWNSQTGTKARRLV